MEPDWQQVGPLNVLPPHWEYSLAQEEEEGGGEGAAGGGKGLAPGYTADDRAEFVFFCSEIMDCSLDFRVLIAAVSQVPLGAGRGAEDGADWVLLAPGAASTLSHVQLGEQEESSLHMRWGIWPSQMLLAAVQPPQWAVVLHVYLLHLFGGGGRGSVCRSDLAVGGCCCMLRGATTVRQWQHRWRRRAFAEVARVRTPATCSAELDTKQKTGGGARGGQAWVWRGGVLRQAGTGYRFRAKASGTER